MAPQLIQIKVQPALKKDLQQIATYKGIPVTSFIKLTLTEAAREEKKKIYTENGLTEKEEQEVLRRGKEAMEDYRKGKLKPLTFQKLLKELDE